MRYIGLLSIAALAACNIPNNQPKPAPVPTPPDTVVVQHTVTDTVTLTRTDTLVQPAPPPVHDTVVVQSPPLPAVHDTVQVIVVRTDTLPPIHDTTVVAGPAKDTVFTYLPFVPNLSPLGGDTTAGIVTYYAGDQIHAVFYHGLFRGDVYYLNNSPVRAYPYTPGVTVMKSIGWYCSLDSALTAMVPGNESMTKANPDSLPNCGPGSNPALNQPALPSKIIKPRLRR